MERFLGKLVVVEEVVVVVLFSGLFRRGTVADDAVVVNCLDFIG